MHTSVTHAYTVNCLNTRFEKRLHKTPQLTRIHLAKIYPIKLPKLTRLNYLIHNKNNWLSICTIL